MISMKDRVIYKILTMPSYHECTDSTAVHIQPTSIL